MIGRTRLDDLIQALLQGFPSRHDNSNADSTFAMESLKVLKVAIKEWIFVIPLDFKGNGPILGSPHMIDFMRSCGTFIPVDNFPYNDITLRPASAS